MADNGGSVDSGTSKVQVNISVKGNHILFVTGLDLAALGSALGTESGVEDQFCASQRLVGQFDGGCQLVVS